MVEDGRPFCPQCRAPQIHVQVAAATGESAPVTSDGSHDPPVTINQGAGFGRSPAISHSLLDRGAAVRAALKAGFLGVFIGMIPVLGIVLTGSLSVYFYRREKGFVPGAAIGARVGGAAGMVVFAVNALFIIPIIVFHLQQQCIDGFVEMAQKFGINTTTPQFQASIQNLFTPSGLASFFFIVLVLSAAGGALAALFFRPASLPR